MTPYLEFAMEEQEDNIKRCVRWMLSTPIGETRFQAPDEAGNTLSSGVQTNGVRSARNATIGGVDQVKNRPLKNGQATTLPKRFKEVVPNVRGKIKA